ncbi:FAD binding domain-containing protein [Novosphingobium sp. JCM 18896]|uniref:FAD binding domain-containing protein n=1 Tax=Novosphingobium sp. JCM 18896 TaxID=2989731 RepID=UPI0022225929|nr:xanthine dehydrogenase family protein subunit M [Novosphingobium sp. JCM 18896]MCW1428201.1 xanthine dehydrogenase family protein subunit M [Novosphingobium sp. JCM 18896]
MSSPAYHAPETIEQAVALLAGDAGARPLAGGTDLIVQMRSGRNAPSAIVDLKRIAGLSGIRALPGGGFAIGAATPCTALKDDAALAAAWPGVVEAANLIGSVQVRNRATMAGNLCNASPAADSVPALVAAGATCLVAGPNGQREVPVEAIPAGPGKTSLAPGEVLVEIRLPAQLGADAYLRSIPRSEMDIAVVGAGVSLVLGAGGVCTAARVAIGAVAPTVVLVEAAGAALIGGKLDDAALEAAADAVRAACRPIDDKRGTAEYRTAMAGVLVKRTAKIALERAHKNQGRSQA